MYRLYAIIICLLQLILISCNAQISGCTDPLANNYNPSASINDGSCNYDPVSVDPVSTFLLSEALKETSGLIIWDGLVWSHNDHEDTRLYGLDNTSAEIIRYIELLGIENRDWEEISQDESYIYVGDFGNNYSGNRMDLHLLRIKKSSLNSGNPDIDTIWFSYNNQVNLDPAESQRTDFDCEAFMSTGNRGVL